MANYGRVEIFEEETLGVGSYGKVCKAKCGQLPCAAKLLHQTMFQFGDPGVNEFTRRFLKEGEFLSGIKHPNIVQYLATVQDPKSGRPVLLMELMEESLTKFLERGACPPPYHTQLNICYDVALALSYLHTNHIIHRDLSSNNVLLMGAGRRAKVTDFGMSRLMDMNPRMTPLTKCPGIAVSMPPETLTDSPHYSDKMDCFSWGVLAVQVMTGNFPDPTDARSFCEDKRFPTGRVIVLVPEVERRKKDIDLIKDDHPLRPEALHCLKDQGEERPSASELCERLSVLRGEERYREGVKQEQAQSSQIVLLEQELDAKGKEVQAKDNEIQEAKKELEAKEREIAACHQQLEEKQQVIQAKEKEIEACRGQLEEKDENIRAKEMTIKTNKDQLKAREQLIQNADVEIKRLDDELKKMKQNVSDKVKLCNTKYDELVARHKIERERRQKDIKAKQGQLESTLQSLEKLVVEEKRLLDQSIDEEETYQTHAAQEMESLLNELVTVPGSKTEMDIHSALEQVIDKEQARLTTTGPELSIPDYKTQKAEILPALQQSLKKGDTWYLVDVRWMDQWKKYVGFDMGDQKFAGLEGANPGPLDNSYLFEDINNGILKKKLKDGGDYSILPESAWHKFVAWYGITNRSRPIPRKVAWWYTKYYVEIYQLQFKLCLYPKQNGTLKWFNRADTIAHLESETKKTLSIAADEQCRIWRGTDTLLGNSSQTLQEAGLDSEQNIVLEVRNKDGTWPMEHL